MSKKRKHDGGANSKSGTQKARIAAHKKAVAQKPKAPPSEAEKARRKQLQQNQRPPPPFSPSDSVLLVGEGDFSFALSLKRGLGVRKVTATSYDSAEEVARKYPQAAENIAALLSGDPPKKDGEEEEEQDEIAAALDGWDSDSSPKTETEYAVHHSIDATALLKRRVFSKSSKRYDRIVFQFPHVGGITKDQDRQVRSNQQLLLGFFKSAAPLLSPTGTVVVTLFEGMPYELWNIRGLAKEAGLVTKISFAFEAAEYPGYKHVRTLGNLEGGGGWKGEERKARMYIFGTGAAGSRMAGSGAGGDKKRKTRDDDDEDE
jgi:25S rRNA (uracil2634-N3)-methyltransferase